VDESLRAITRGLSEPGLDLASLMCDAVTRIRMFLDGPELGPAAARLSGIKHVVDELCPPPPPGDYGLLYGAVPPGTGPGQVAALIADLLAGHPAPATALLAQLAGEDIRITVRDEQRRPLLARERSRLAAPEGTAAYTRRGELVTVSGVTVARSSLTVIPALLPDDVRDGLAGDVPFGALAAPHGMTRQARVAAVTGRPDPAVESTALLVLGGRRAGIGWEQVTGDFCAHAARQAAAAAT
jgi:hypothetical protein